MNNPSKLQSEAVKTFLTEGTKNGCGDLSIMVSVLTDQIQKAYSKGREEVKLKWTDYDIENPNEATHEWLEVHKKADEVIFDRMGNPSYVLYNSPISQAHKIMKEKLSIQSKGKIK